jgi:hypothetical protein
MHQAPTFTQIALPDFQWSFGTRGKLLPSSSTGGHPPQLQAQTIYCLLQTSLVHNPRLLFIFQLAYSTIGLTKSCQLSCRIRSIDSQPDAPINHVWSVHLPASLLQVERQHGDGERVTLEDSSKQLRCTFSKCFRTSTVRLELVHPQLCFQLTFQIGSGYAAGSDNGMFMINIE